MEKDLVALDYRVKALEENDLKNQNTHREFYTRIQAIETTNAVSREQYNQIMERFETVTSKFDNIAGQLSTITSQPAKRWNGLVDKALYGGVGIIVAYIFAQIGF